MNPSHYLFISVLFAKFEPAASVLAPFFDYQTKTRPVHFLQMNIHVPNTPKKALRKL